MKRPCISLENVIINKKFPVINLSAQENDVILLHGRNGSGKSTLLKTIIGLLPIKSGVRSLQGIQIGYVPQICTLPGWITPEQFLSYKAALTDVYKMIEKVLDIVDLTREKHTSVKNFSHGMLQRLFIANALLANPDILILDEPFASVDSDNQRRIKQFIFQRKNEPQIIIMASHESERFATRIIEL